MNTIQHIKRTGGRVRLLFGKFADNIKKGVEMANDTQLPVEIVDEDYRIIGYIVSKNSFIKE